MHNLMIENQALGKPYDKSKLLFSMSNCHPYGLIQSGHDRSIFAN